MNKPSLQSGFSAIELLITLFIAFLFVMMGYQLYSVVIKDGGEARAQARASNLAYTWARYYQDTAFGFACNTSGTSYVDGTKGILYISITCPNAPLSDNIRLVTSKVVYGTQQQEATHAIYATQ